MGYVIEKTRYFVYLNAMEISKIIASVQTQLYDFMPSLASGLAMLVIGLFLASMIANRAKNALLKSKIEDELSLFLAKILKIAIQVIVVVSALSIWGIKTSSFLAVLGSAGLAVGLALQGSLSNLAGGVLILILKPFRLNDFVEYAGHMGTVEAINIFNTTIRTGDNKVIIIPNGPLANGVVINHTVKDTRRNEWIFGIGYNDDIAKAKDIILSHLNANSMVLKDPAPFIAVKELADSSVNIVVRAWCLKDDLWPLYFETLEAIKFKFDEQGISIPFPQRDVHLVQEASH